jgi:lipopolysaccharide transport system permease protein
MSQKPPLEANWTTVIKTHRGALDWRLGELWRCRDLISLFVWRDFVALYKQTILGPLWHLVVPLLTTITFTVVFGRVAKLPTDGVPPFLFYLSGTVVWAYFAGCLNKTSNAFVANASLYGKVYFHRLAIPVSVVISTLIGFAIQLLLFLATLGIYLARGTELHPNLWALSLPLLIVMMAGFGLGFGIIVSSLTTRYRDLTMLVAFGVQLWMYASPVIYPSSSVPEKYRWVVACNPMTPVIETFRHGFLGVGTAAPGQLAVSFAVMLAVLAVGLLLFSRVEQSFMDTV